MIIINPICISCQDLLKEYSEEEIKTIVSSFSCPREPFIEDFVQQKCIHAEKMGNTRSYFIFDADDFALLGYYALTLKILHLKKISKKKAKALHLPDNVNQSLPTYYIGLLAKNETYKDQIEGKYILENALDIIETAADYVGGRVIWLEAKKCNQGVMNLSLIHI